MTGKAKVTAKLTPDGGEAAASEEFFRSPEFLLAEGATHSLQVGEALALPLIVREIPGSDRIDATSPYGFPGASGSPDPPPAAPEVDWAETGLVSVFVRDRIPDPPAFRDPLESRAVQVADPDRPSGIRPRLREQIRATERAGYRPAHLPGPDAGREEQSAFERIYTETMRRTGAAERYFFGKSYFEAVLSSPRSWLVLCRGPSGEPAAAAIAVLSDDLLHYFLGGTADEHLPASPMKNLFAEMIELAAELGVTLNLGGGVEPGDGLERFKRGFANGELPFRTHEIVCDRDAYEELSAGTDASAEFFPRYRAGVGG